jgi:pimeloyl-ACP methyl ester carboxylesterase
LHYIHEKATANTSAGQQVIPLLLLHGWPSSVVDFIETIKPLAHPGNAALPAFDVVVPSQTGYLWSSSPTVDAFGRGKGSGPQGDFLVKGEYFKGEIGCIRSDEIK